MPFQINNHALLWSAVVLVIAVLIGRIAWVLCTSRKWPTADGTITRFDVQRRQDGGLHGGHYFSALFTYEFHDLGGNLTSGTWYKDFSNVQAARDFAEREMPIGKQVLVRFNPKDPGTSDLELDSFAYTNDRPTSLNL